MVAKSLGIDVVWVGFLGGAAGEECESGLSAFGVPLTVVRTQAETRANLEIISSDGMYHRDSRTWLAAVTDGEVERLLATCRDIFADGTIEHRLPSLAACPRAHRQISTLQISLDWRTCTDVRVC
jgi:fructose-1-phosphate kinase PfkB-like protein